MKYKVIVVNSEGTEVKGIVTSDINEVIKAILSFLLLLETKKFSELIVVTNEVIFYADTFTKTDYLGIILLKDGSIRLENFHKEQIKVFEGILINSTIKEITVIDTKTGNVIEKVTKSN